MRLPSSARLGALLAFACLVLSLVVVTPGALAVRSGGGDKLEAVEQKLAQCRKDVADARDALGDFRDLLALASRRPFVFVPVAGLTTFPLSVESLRDAIILEYVTGKITRPEMVTRLQTLARRARETVKVLKELIADAAEGIERSAKRCAALKEERDRLRAGGGGGTGGATGAFPGGTATTMKLTIGGTSVTTNLKTNKQDRDPTIKGRSSGSLSGSVELNGTLPNGWTVVVFHNGASDIVLNSRDGGDFTIKPISTGFDAFTQPSAYVCSTKVPPLCSPRAQARISVDWDP